MVRVLGEGVGADRADVWLAVDGELRDVATWPSRGEPSPVALEDHALATISAELGRAFPVLHGGECSGSSRCASR